MPPERGLPTRNDIMLALFELEEAALLAGGAPTADYLEAVRLQRRQAMERVDTLVEELRDRCRLHIEADIPGWPDLEADHSAFVEHPTGMFHGR